MEEKRHALVANEPRVYREVISNALKKLRPLIEVYCASEPGELDREVARLRPHLVICSRPSEAVAAAGCLMWVVLYPDGEDRAEICSAAGGVRTALLSGVEFSDLLRVVDETELLCRSGAEGRA